MDNSDSKCAVIRFDLNQFNDILNEKIARGEDDGTDKIEIFKDSFERFNIPRIAQHDKIIYQRFVESNKTFAIKDPIKIIGLE